ncbi:MAG: TolC family protein [Hydrotalea sp.]|nr:TolC family protein [Hydrotalea sp.]
MRQPSHRPFGYSQKAIWHFFILTAIALAPQDLRAQDSSGQAQTATPATTATYDFVTALRDALANDPRLAAANEALTAQAASAQITKMSALPQLTTSGYIGNYTQKKFQQIPNYYTLSGPFGNQRIQVGSTAGTVTISGTLSEANLTASQNLLTFGRQQANEGISDSQYRLAQWQQKKIAYQITTDVANNYIGCATAGEIAKTKQFYRSSLQSIYNNVKRKYDVNAATNTDLNLAAINYRNAANDLLLQQQQVATSCQKLLRLTAQDMDYKQLLPRLSLADLDQYDKLIPNNFDDIKNTTLANNPDLGTAVESLTLRQKQKEQAVANLMPIASWSAKVEQLTVPGSVSRNGVTPSATINNQSATITLNYQQNIMQSIFQLSASNHKATAQSYLAAEQLQTTVNQLLNLWQNYQANKKSLPFMVRSLHELELSVAGIDKLYNRGIAPLSALLQKRQEFFANLIQYHQLHENQLIGSLTLLALLGHWS